MSAKEKKKCRNVKLKNCKRNIVDYLYKRSTNGYQNDSKNFANKLFDAAKDLYKKDLTAHFGCVNAIEFSGDGNLLFSGGDDRRVLMWNINDAMMHQTGRLGGSKPFTMKGCHYSNIFCLAVDNENKRVLSGSNDDQVIVHDYTTGNPIDIFLHDSPVFSLSLHPDNGNIFASAADNGRILIYDVRESNADLLCVAKLRTPFHGVMFNPWEPSLIATANSKVGVHIWDLRKPKEILIKCNDEPSMAVRWNQYGTILLALRNLLPIAVYDPLVPKKKLEFDSQSYFNACTMKSCSFAGANDEYILSGSDDFNLYMWKIPDPWPENRWVGSEHLTLAGHRSIVNQVRYTSTKQLIATSGVEKIIKLWSPFHLPYSQGDPDKPSAKRLRVLCSSKSCTRSPGFLSHDYSQESVEEDTRMIHFFDSLLQNELDDMPLSQSFYLDTSLFNVTNRKKEKRLYEKLIKKKKKYLSKLLIGQSDESKLICSLNVSTASDKQHKLSSISTSKNQLIIVPENNSVGTSSNGNQIEVGIINEEESMNGLTSNSLVSSTDFYPSYSSSSKACNVASSTISFSDSRLNSEPMLSNSATSSRQSKISCSINVSDTEDSNESVGQNFMGKKSNNLNKDCGINFSENNESNQLQSCTFFKRKRSSAKKCYRNLTKRKRINSHKDDSSDSELLSESNIRLEPSSSKADERFTNCNSDL